MTKKELSELVDKIGILKASIAPQLAVLSQLEAQLKGIAMFHKETPYVAEGALFRATVSSYEQDRLDMDAVRAKLSPQFIAAHTTKTSVVKLSVKAKVLQPAEKKAA